MGSVELIGCSSVTSITNTDSIQAYDFENAFGTISEEVTIVRTGGADDQATGVFTYAHTPHANIGLASSNAALKSRFMRVWVDGGTSITLTIFTTHDNAGSINRDLYESEMWAEVFTPDNGDTAQHDFTAIATAAPTLGDQDIERLFSSTTATGADDTASTWATHNTYKRKFTVTFTPGYAGWAYARVYLAYNNATPVTVYIDPKIEIT